MDTRKILSAIGTFAVVGAVSTAGAALWTKVLNRKFQMVQLKLIHPEVRQNYIRRLQEGKEGPLTQRLFPLSAQKAVSFMETKLLGGNQE